MFAAFEIFAFAGGAVAAIAAVEFVVAGGQRQDLEDVPPNVEGVGGSVSVLSVGLAVACVHAVGRPPDGLSAEAPGEAPPGEQRESQKRAPLIRGTGPGTPCAASKAADNTAAGGPPRPRYLGVGVGPPLVQYCAGGDASDWRWVLITWRANDRVYAPVLPGPPTARGSKLIALRTTSSHLQ
jgi:hypothetical protein